MRQLLVSIVLVIAALCPAFAQDRPIYLPSFNDTSCGTWAKANNTKNPVAQAQYYSWFRGFVSGYNFSNPNNQVLAEAMPNQETIKLFVDKFCRENPLLPFIDAAFQLVEDLKEKR
jgi:hypothetical protein